MKNLFDNKLVFAGRKSYQYYKGLLIRADRGLHEHIAIEIQSRCPVGSKVLDMGAGQGALSLRLADLGYRVKAIDNSQEDLKAQEGAFESEIVDFDQPDALETFVANNECSYDVVLGIEVIEHVENPWAYMRSLRRMARPGGLVIVSTPHTGSWLSRIYFLRTGRFMGFEEEDLRYGHINPIAPFELELIMHRSGLKNIEIISTGTLPPIYATSWRNLLLSMLGLLARPLQKGILDGYCIVGIGQAK